MRLVVCGLVVLAMLSGCVKTRSKGSIKSDQVELSSTGDVKEAAQGSQKKSETTIPLPAKSTVESKPDGTVTVTLSKPSEMRSATSDTSISTAVPPPPPSPDDEAHAKATFWTTLGLRAAVALGCVGLIFGLVKDWDLVAIGGGSVAGAGLFGLFVQRHPVLFIFIGLGVTLAVVGPWLWHTKLKNANPFVAK